MTMSGVRLHCRRPTRHCVRWGPSSPSLWHSPQFFGQCPLWPNGWMDEDATWYGSRPRARPHCIRRGPSSPRKGHSGPHPSFRPMFTVATVAHLSYCLALVYDADAIQTLTAFSYKIRSDKNKFIVTDKSYRVVSQTVPSMPASIFVIK